MCHHRFHELEKSHRGTNQIQIPTPCEQMGKPRKTRANMARRSEKYAKAQMALTNDVTTRCHTQNAPTSLTSEIKCALPLEYPTGLQWFRPCLHIYDQNATIAPRCCLNPIVLHVFNETTHKSMFVCPFGTL